MSVWQSDTYRCSYKKSCTTTTSRLMVSVQMLPVRIGWLVVEQYGPVRRPLWFLRRRSAEEAYDAASLEAGRFAMFLKDPERRQALPKDAGVRGNGTG